MNSPFMESSNKDSSDEIFNYPWHIQNNYKPFSYKSRTNNRKYYPYRDTDIDKNAIFLTDLNSMDGGRSLYPFDTKPLDNTKIGEILSNDLSGQKITPFGIMPNDYIYPRHLTKREKANKEPLDKQQNEKNYHYSKHKRTNGKSKKYHKSLHITDKRKRHKNDKVVERN